MANNFNSKIIDNLCRADLNYYTTKSAGAIAYRLNVDQALIDSKLNETLRQIIECSFFIFAGLTLLNYIYLGIFSIFTIFMGIFFYRILKQFIRVTCPILQFRERARISVVKYYIKTLQSMVSFRGMGNSRLFETI